MPPTEEKEGRQFIARTAAGVDAMFGCAMPKQRFATKGNSMAAAIAVPTVLQRPGGVRSI